MGKVVVTVVASLTIAGYLGAKNPPYRVNPVSNAAAGQKGLVSMGCEKTPASDILNIANSSTAMVSHKAKALAVIDVRATTLVNGTAVASYSPGGLEVCGAVLTTTYKTALLIYKKGIDTEGQERLIILADVDFPGSYPLLYPSQIPILQDKRPCRGNLEWGDARICTDTEAGWILPDVANSKF